MSDQNTMDDARLHAYVDGELDAEALAEAEDWLAGHPDDAKRARAYRSQRKILHALYDGVLDEPLPRTVLSALAGRAPGRGTAPWMRVAAAVAIFALGGIGGWFAHGLGPSTGGAPVFIDQAVGAHRVYVKEVLHPVEVGADQEAHLVAWLSKRLGHMVRAPDMTGAGFSLVGGRLLPDGGRTAAQFMYEDPGGRRVTLYVRPQGGDDTAFRFVSDRGVSAFYWIDGPLAYALIGNVPREALLELSRIAYEAL